MFYEFSQVDLRSAVLFVASRAMGIPETFDTKNITRSQAVPINQVLIEEYTRAFFDAVQIKCNKSVPGAFASDLWSDHYDAYMRFAKRANPSWIQGSQLERMFGSDGAELLGLHNKQAGDTLSLEISLGYRYAIVADIILRYMKQRRLRQLDSNSYAAMVRELQTAPTYFPLAVAVRVAIAQSEQTSVDQMLEAKGEQIQKFGCFFWVLC